MEQMIDRQEDENELGDDIENFDNLIGNGYNVKQPPMKK
jgi:hypothetical protein